jgi:Na+-driven multidrug efflux pump
MHLSTTIPAVFMQKYMAMAAEFVGEFEDIMAIWNVLLRLNQFSICVVLAFNTAFIPAASYAFGRGQYRRILYLLLHLVWITFLWAGICECVMCLIPRQLGQIWSRKENFLKWVEKLLRPGFYGIVLAPAPYISIAFLNSVNEPCFSAVLSVLTNLIPLPVFSTIMYFTGKEDPVRIVWAYLMRDGFSFVMSLVIAARPLWRIVKEARKEVSMESASIVADSHSIESTEAKDEV